MSVKGTPRRLFRRVHILPALLTLGNFSCGFFAIVLCLNAVFFSIRAQTIDMHTPNTEIADSTIMSGRTAQDRGKRDMLTLSSARGANARSAYMFHLALCMIFLGMLFDVLDGKVARHMGADSAFGLQLDSLADVTTFGVAPPIIVNTLWIAVMPVTSAWWGQVVVFGVVYAVCTVLRLARYNIQSGTGDKNIFSGLPCPAAAGCVVTAVLVAVGDYWLVGAVCDWLAGLIGGVSSIQIKANLLAFFVLLPGLLQVSTIPYVHVANRYFSGKKSFFVLVVLVLLLALVWHEPRLMLFALFNGYMLVGLVNEIRRRYRGMREKGHAAGEA